MKHSKFSQVSGQNANVYSPDDKPGRIQSSCVIIHPASKTVHWLAGPKTLSIKPKARSGSD